MWNHIDSWSGSVTPSLNYFSKSFSLNEEESKGMDMEGEGGKPSIGERELSTKASETVSEFSHFQRRRLHFFEQNKYLAMGKSLMLTIIAWNDLFWLL